MVPSEVPETMHGKYPKIPTIWKRDPDTHKLIVGAASSLELAMLDDHDFEWEFEEKIDGMNVRVHWDGDQVYFAGKTDRADIERIHDTLENYFGGESREQLLEQTFGDRPATLYGEGFGGNIQARGPQYIPDGRTDFVLLDVRVGHVWLAIESVQDIAESLGLITAPGIGRGTLKDATELSCDGFASTFGTADAEGLVLRPRETLLDRKGNRIMGKIKTEDFG